MLEEELEEDLELEELEDDDEDDEDEDVARLELAREDDAAADDRASDDERELAALLEADAVALPELISELFALTCRA